MKRNVFPLPKEWESRELKQQCLGLAKNEAYFALLDSNHHRQKYSRFHWLCGWAKADEVYAHQNSLRKLRDFHQLHQDWCFGHLSFNLKNELENLWSRLPDSFNYPHLEFFVPEHVLYQTNEGLFCESLTLRNHLELQQLLNKNHSLSLVKPKPQFDLQTSRESYLDKIEQLKQQLQYGNIYEINFCIEFKARGELPAENLFSELNKKHQAPFSAFYKRKKQFLLCFSPERYLQKNGQQLISQPIKGTAARAAKATLDQKNINALKNSEKEQAENVMIVDLVRNDLSRTACPGTVKVPELFGIYTYPALHQMMSTVESTMDNQRHFTEALQSTFPMGSMTGAPKISALQLIDKHEDFNRGLYSGSVGYITPQGDFDFNVVIRSILYDAEQQVSSVRVGSAITIHCDAEKEFEECLLKAEKLI